MHNNDTQHINSASALYKSNCEFARKLKEKWLSTNDPILQRDNKYVPHCKQTQQCKLNYFERMKQKEQQAKQHKQSFKGNNSNCRNLFTESSEPKYKCHKKRVFTPESGLSVKRGDKGIRVFPLVYKNEQISNILTRGGDNSGNNCNGKQRMSYKPSEGYVRMNNKKMFLPFENRINTNDSSSRGCSGNIGNVNNKEGSKERIFGTALTSNGTVTPSASSSNASSKMKYIHKNNVKLKTDHVNDIITYKYGPTFKDEQLTSKPNNIDYNNILTKHKQNIQNDYLYI